MTAFENPDLYPPAAHVACDFPRTATNPRYQTPDQFAKHWIAGLWRKLRQDVSCAAALRQGREVFLRGKSWQTANY
jgi:hypothetical protein